MRGRGGQRLAIDSQRIVRREESKGKGETAGD
jgi:hypothetical protein